MKAKKTFYTMIAAAGMSLGALALAQEAEIGTPVHSRCDISATTIEEHQILEDNGGLNLFDIQNTSATEAFCVGLQSHGDESSNISFSDKYSFYAESRSKTIMGVNVSNYYNGLGSARCVPVGGGLPEACNRDLNPALNLVYPQHLDYSDPEFSESTISVSNWASANVASGDYAGVSIGDFATAKLYSADRYNTKNLTIGRYSTVYLNAGDYYIEKLTMHEHSRIVVSGSGTARLFLKNNPYLDDYVTLNWRKDPKNLVVIADGDLSAYKHVYVAGYVYAGGNITLNNYCIVEGAVNANNITLYDNSAIIEKRYTIAYVDFGEITANPLPWNQSLLVYAPDENRHSGDYGLIYPIAQAEQYSQADRYVDNAYYGNLATLVNNAWDDYVDPTKYLDQELLAETGLEVPAVESDEMTIGHIYGVISVSVNGLTVFPLLVDIPINLDIPSLLDETDIAENRDLNQQSIDIEINDPELYTVTFIYASGEPAFLSEADTQADLDAAAVGAISIIYDHNVLAGYDSYDGFPTKAERDAKVEEWRQAQYEELDNTYDKIISQWNAARSLKVPSAVDFDTWYPDSTKSFGFAVRHFNNGSTWIGAMNNNYYAGLPIVFPVNLFPVPLAAPVGGGFALGAAWCGAWIAAFEVGCFQPEYGEPNYVEGVPSNACEATLEEGTAAVPVDAALHSFAGANLTCGVWFFNTVIAATVGFGIETHPVSEL